MSESSYRNRPRRRFSREFKREVVELLLQQAATVAEVARDYDLHPNQLCRWRTEYFRGEFGPAHVKAPEAPAFLPIELSDFVPLAGAQPNSEPPSRDALKDVALADDATRTQLPSCARLKVRLPKGELFVECCDAGFLRVLIEALQ